MLPIVVPERKGIATLSTGVRAKLEGENGLREGDCSPCICALPGPSQSLSGTEVGYGSDEPGRKSGFDEEHRPALEPPSPHFSMAPSTALAPSSSPCWLRVSNERVFLTQGKVSHRANTRLGGKCHQNKPMKL